MKASNVMGTLLAGSLVMATISANAMEGVVYDAEHYKPANNTSGQVTTGVDHADRNSDKIPAKGPLDIVFVVSNGLLGFFLLRKVNSG
jgi:hypothetical protein